MFSIKLVPYINLVKITDEVCFIRRNGADHKVNQINCSYTISVTNAHITRELKSTTALVTCKQALLGAGVKVGVGKTGKNGKSLHWIKIAKPLSFSPAPPSCPLPKNLLTGYCICLYLYLKTNFTFYEIHTYGFAYMDYKLCGYTQHASDKQQQVTQNLLLLLLSYFVAQYVLIIVV